MKIIIKLNLYFVHIIYPKNIAVLFLERCKKYYKTHEILLKKQILDFYCLKSAVTGTICLYGTKVDTNSAFL